MMVVAAIVITFCIQNQLITSIGDEYTIRAKAAAMVVASTVTTDIMEKYLDSGLLDAQYESILGLLRARQRELMLNRITVEGISSEGETYIFDTSLQPGVRRELGEFVPWGSDRGRPAELPLILLGQNSSYLTNYSNGKTQIDVRLPVFKKDGSISGTITVSMSVGPVMAGMDIIVVNVLVIVSLILLITGYIQYMLIRGFVVTPIDGARNFITAKYNEIVSDINIARGDINAEHYVDGRKPKNEVEALIQLADFTGESTHNIINDLIFKGQYHFNVFSIAPYACITFDRDYSITECNESALTMLRFGNKYDLRNGLQNIISTLQSNSGTVTDVLYMGIEKAFREGFYSYEDNLMLPDNKNLPVKVSMIRTKFKNDYMVAVYLFDLSDVSVMEDTINKLAAKADEAYVDQLTHVRNRRYLDEQMKNLMGRMSRGNDMLSVAMIDIDYFKRYNDTYGHAEGDNALREVAKAIKKGISRMNDFVARYGGEEFVVIMPDTNKDGAVIVIDKIMHNLREKGIPHSASDVSDVITISIGIASGVVQHRQSGDDFIKLADEMLYKAKEGGRNGYVSGEMETPEEQEK
jgi:diguanylate cyclase (GGDEF)-like protein